MNLYDHADVDPADIAADAFTRRPSISGTPSCRGCDDPQCGYCEDYREATREERVEAERDKIMRSDSDLLDCLDAVFVNDQQALIADALRLALDRDDLAACDRLRDALEPRIAAMAERRVS